MEEINLYKLLGFYARNWLLIVLITLAGLLTGVAFNEFIQTPKYKSDATLLLIKEAEVTQDANAILLNNYVELFQSRRVLEPVIESQNLDVRFEDFIKNVDATSEKNTEVLRLSVTTKDPRVSQDFLLAAVENFKEEAEELYGTKNLIIVDNASDAEPPYNVNKTLQLIIAGGIGLIVSLLVLFFIYDAKGDNFTIWKKKARVIKTKTASSIKPKKVKRSKIVLRKNRDLGLTKAWSKFAASAKNSLWIEESKTDAPKRDKTEN